MVTTSNVSLSSTPSQILAANQSRISWVIRNNDTTNDCKIGGPSVLFSNGITIPKGQAFGADHDSQHNESAYEIWGVCDTGKTAAIEVLSVTGD